MLDDPNIIGIYKLVYQTIDFAAVREHFSSNLLKNLGIKHVQSFDSLPLYIRDVYRNTGKEKKKNKVLIAGSAAWLNLSMHLRDEKGNIENYQSGIDFLIEYIDILNKKGYEVSFIMGAQAYPSQDDIEFLEYLKIRKAQILLIEAKSLNEWLDHISEASLLVSGRFHHTIAAACLKTPFILFNSNTPKTEALAQYLNSEPLLQYQQTNLLEILLKRTDFLLSPSYENKQQTHSLETLSTLAIKNYEGL